MTFTVNEQVAVLPDASVAVHNTVVAPLLNTWPASVVLETVTAEVTPDRA